MKHIGRHGDKNKVLIVYKTIPDESHMCLIVYTDKLNTPDYQKVMKVVESDEGQAANDIADILHVNKFDNGELMLLSFHKRSMLKKVPTNQVVVIASAKNTIRLDELNTILVGMQQGEEAVKKMAEIDAQAGLRDPQKNNKISTMLRAGEIFSDEQMANNLREQANTMQNDAERLLTESQKLFDQAHHLNPREDKVDTVTVVKKANRPKKNNVITEG